jgi:hypothetical protein
VVAKLARFDPIWECAEISVREQISLIMLRSAITAASSRSGSKPMVMSSFGVSAIGHSSEVVADMQFEGPDQPGLDRGDADFAVALHAVAIADREQRAIDVDRQIKRAAGDELFIVHIAAVATRRRRTFEAKSLANYAALFIGEKRTYGMRDLISRHTRKAMTIPFAPMHPFSRLEMP